MGLIRRNQQEPLPTLITLKEASALLRLTPSAIRQNKAGTRHLTKVRQGEGKRQPIFLVLEEVEAHIRSLVENARELNAVAGHHVFGSNSGKKGRKN
jgi:hypothetical protein